MKQLGVKWDKVTRSLAHKGLSVRPEVDVRTHHAEYLMAVANMHNEIKFWSLNGYLICFVDHSSYLEYGQCIRGRSYCTSIVQRRRSKEKGPSLRCLAQLCQGLQIK